MTYKVKIAEAYARVEWCKKQFGGFGYGYRWRRIKGYLYFNDEKDYLLYCLRWSDDVGSTTVI